MSDTLRPSTIVELRPKVDMGQKKMPFGSYEMIHVGTMNTIKINFVPGVVLKASNDYGGYYFMNIFTGIRIRSYNWE